MELAIDGNTSGALQSWYEQSEHTSNGHEYIIVKQFFWTPFFAFSVYILYTHTYIMYMQL